MVEEMTPRERVLIAFEHHEPDRVPIDFSSTHNSGINVLAYNCLKETLGLNTLTYMRDLIPMLASPDLEEGLDLFNMMGGDLLPMPRHINFGVPAEASISAASLASVFRRRDVWYFNRLKETVLFWGLSPGR